MLVLILNLNRINIQTRAFVQALEGGVPSFGLQVYAHFGMEIVWYSGRCMLEQYLDEFGWVRRRLGRASVADCVATAELGESTSECEAMKER